MAVVPQGDVFAHGLRLIRVVEHQQPVLVRLPLSQCLQNRIGHILDAGGLGKGHPQMRRQCGQRGGNQERLVGGDPPHHLVTVAIPPGVLDGELGLTHTAKAL